MYVTTKSLIEFLTVYRRITHLVTEGYERFTTDPLHRPHSMLNYYLCFILFSIWYCWWYSIYVYISISKSQPKPLNHHLPINEKTQYHYWNFKCNQIPLYQFHNVISIRTKATIRIFVNYNAFVAVNSRTKYIREILWIRLVVNWKQMMWLVIL